MNTLTTKEFYITENVKERVEKDRENYNEILNNFFPNDMEAIPLLAFAYHSIEEYPNLLDKLNYSESRDEFSINAYYYLLEQQDEHWGTGIDPIISSELARKDLLEVYKSYDEQPLIP